MYALTFKKVSKTTKLLRFALRYKYIMLGLGLALSLFADGLYIYAKAELAQALIERSWNTRIESGQVTAPWPWADTHPIAKLSIADAHWYVLAGASGRNLAFGPAHVSATPAPGKLGNSVIVGHRDTQFNALKHIQAGTLITIRTEMAEHTFKVISARIAHQSQLEYMYMREDKTEVYDDSANLTLITCYPFDSLIPNPSHRYVVRAVAI